VLGLSDVCDETEGLMKPGRLLAIAFVWALSLISVALWAQGREAVPPPAGTILPPDTTGRVLSGENIGFRVNAWQTEKGMLQGTLVVRVNGQWVAASFTPGFVR
jgi:hypothetical protein